MTHNIINGMGLSGWKGSFKVCAEITLNLFKRESELFEAHLEGFINDPLIEWIKGKIVRVET